MYSSWPSRTEGYYQQLNSGHVNVNTAIFALEEEGRQKLVVREDSKPYSCVSCGKKFCGQETCDSNRYVCNGCEKMECRKCMLSHMENCPMCLKFDHHCIKCQGKVDNEKYCHLCGFNICKNHARKCDKCGLVTCGIHDYSVDTCSFCKKGFCSGCHSHGDYMWNCADCGERSCNASGDKANTQENTNNKTNRINTRLV